MCGIAGIASTGGRPVDLDALRRMDRGIAHRGPDDAGEWVRPGGDVAFAHRRLSIIDLSPAGHQPFASGDGRLVITYNGEIYNFRELRRELEARGCAFHSSSDTEVIVAGYAVWGAAVVERLRGMFAFALWDERERACVLARDRFGIKPLYYACGPESLVFASEMRALVSSRLIETEADPIGIQRYLQSGSVPEPDTLLRKVKVLEAASIGVWRDGRFDARRYWSIAFESAAIEWPAAVQRTRTALVDSVRHHFVSDVPVGLFLSGGIDSNALVALARGAGVDDLRTFSIAFDDVPDDEGALAERSARHFGTRHQSWTLDGVAGRELFAGFVAAADQPSIDGLNTFAVSKLARESGLKVVLSGLGGDELFGGYKSFRQVPMIARTHRVLELAGVNTIAGDLLSAGGGAKWRRLGESVRGPASSASTYSAFRGIFTRAEAHALATQFVGGEAPPAPDASDGATQTTGGDAISELELTRYMRNQLLRDADTMSMAHGLELRVPFLDAGLFDTLRTIPAELRLRPHKRLLCEAVPEIPEWITRQPKRGFLFPIDRWLGDEWSDMFAAIERSSPVPLDSWYRKWCVFMLDRWLKAGRADRP